MQEAQEAMQQHTKRKKKREELIKKKHYAEHARNKTRAKSDYEPSDAMEMNIEE